MKSYKTMWQKGFTLTEILIAIGLIAVMAGAMIVIFNPIGQIQKSQDTKRKADLAEIKKALELYYQDTGRYPPSTLDFRISYNSTPINWDGPWSPYMTRVPGDPKAPKKYVYYVSDPAGQTFYLYASLDRTTDSQACNSGNACTTATSGPGANACGGVCNFGVSSPNVTP